MMVGCHNQFNSYLLTALLFSTNICKKYAFTSPPISSQITINNLLLHAEYTAENLLQEYNLDTRLKTIDSSDFPIKAEIFDHGSWELCNIISMEPSSTKTNPPRVKVQIMSDNNNFRIVDFGQITTVWDHYDNDKIINEDIINEESNSIPLQYSEIVLQNLYQKVNLHSRNSKIGKKQVSKIVKDTPDAKKENLMNVIRKIIKSGEGMSRLIDSNDAMEYLYEDNLKTKGFDKETSRAVSGNILAHDEKMGGRFNRMGCIFVDAEYGNNQESIKKVSFINGGWLVVDQNARAGAEARKFAERMEGDKLVSTAADERIVHRLECIAMGGMFASDQKNDNNNNENELEVDVRETLKALNLPRSAKGAEEALIRIGKWSRSPDRIEAWSKEMLDAASKYARADMKRRAILSEACRKGMEESIENRVDLTSLPTICIDAKSTRFRDDALGLRPRSQTGRKVLSEASNWEVLIHITDVSDIYSSEPLNIIDHSAIELLRNAAVNRGLSRYDLPRGPLHLLPPTVLESLGFVIQKGHSFRGDKAIPNRCVTIWAYIDERSGKLLDFGLERTLISQPVALTYAEATSLLDNNQKMEKNNPYSKTFAVLKVLERNLELWSKYNQQVNIAAREREKRLSRKELVAGQQEKHAFQRTRGHVLVDTGLDLYSTAISLLLKNVPIPVASGSGRGRRGRVATAPLRRYIDGMAQRQALSVLCNYGGNPFTLNECNLINKQTNEAMNRLANLRPLKQQSISPAQQRALSQLSRISNQKQVLKAISTGRYNEVAIVGNGALGKCLGSREKLKSGQEISVRIKKLDPEKGVLILQHLLPRGRG